MNDGLKEQHRQILIEILRSNVAIERVVLFGSRAMATHSPESDIDLALFGDRLGMRDQSKLSEEIQQTSIPQEVDLLLYASVENEALLIHIREHGVEWFRRSD